MKKKYDTGAKIVIAAAVLIGLYVLAYKPGNWGYLKDVDERTILLTK